MASGAAVKRQIRTGEGLRGHYILRTRTALSETVDNPQRAAEALLARGDALHAYDLLNDALKHQSDVQLLRLQALALARLRATRRANEILAALYARGMRDADTC